MLFFFLLEITSWNLPSVHRALRRIGARMLRSASASVVFPTAAVTGQQNITNIASGV